MLWWKLWTASLHFSWWFGIICYGHCLSCYNRKFEGAKDKETMLDRLTLKTISCWTFQGHSRLVLVNPHDCLYCLMCHMIVYIAWHGTWLPILLDVRHDCFSCLTCHMIAYTAWDGTWWFWLKSVRDAR